MSRVFASRLTTIVKELQRAGRASADDYTMILQPGVTSEPGSILSLTPSGGNQVTIVKLVEIRARTKPPEHRHICHRLPFLALFEIP